MTPSEEGTLSMPSTRAVALLVAIPFSLFLGVCLGENIYTLLRATGLLPG